MAHFLVLTYAAQGHINPALHFATRLALKGAQVTFSTPLSTHRRMTRSAHQDGLSFVPFSDGYDDGFDIAKEGPQYLAELKRVGSRSVSDLIQSFAREGRPVTCLVYTIMLPWAADVAHQAAIPSFLLWIQPASVFTIYYYYFHGHESNLIGNQDNLPSSTVELPGLPHLQRKDLPSFLTASDSYPFILSTIRELFQTLEREEKPQVLVNTFDALEDDALTAVGSMKMIAVGPLIPSNENSSFDLFMKTRDYVAWLDSKPKSSVVYVSFGSLLELSKEQMEEISNGLSETGQPFLWVVREDGFGPESELTNINVGAGEKGLVVPWCSQMEVLLHPSVGCFVTHCGWNSTTEGLASGVPMVCFPQWSDQFLIAKLVEDVWRTGVKAKMNEEGVLEGGELKRCLDMVMRGESGEEIKKSAEKWRDMARESAGKGGSSDRNIAAFVEKGSKESSFS